MDKLHYKGKIDPEPGMIYGPDLHGASYEMTHYSYDSETNTSTAYFKPYLGTKVAL